MMIKEQEIKIHQELSKFLNIPYTEFLPNGGLLFRGEFYDMDGYWRRKEDDEELKWFNSPIKLVILTKDINGGKNGEDAFDIREESGGRKVGIAPYVEYDKKSSFYKRLTRWVYGIFHTDANGFPTFESLKNKDEINIFYEETPLVRINIKAEVGTNHINDIELRNKIEPYKGIIKRQVLLYNPNILLCCGLEVFRFVSETIFSDLKSVEKGEWIFYSEISNCLVINSYHPTATCGESNIGLTDKFLYEEMMKSLTNAFRSLKTF